MLERVELLKAIVSTLEPIDFVLALWQGGSEAHGTTDKWSDLDLRILVEDGVQEAVFRSLEAGLQQFASIRSRYRVPEPTWHKHSQCFYQLVETSPFLLIDLTVMQRSTPNRYLGIERHSAAIVCFDKVGEIQDLPFDRTGHLEQMRARQRKLEATFAIDQLFVQKEIYRDHLAAAIANYHKLTIKPLVELLGMLHRPDRYDFGFKYFDRDFPIEVKTRLTDLMCIRDLKDLQVKQQQAADWFDRTLSIVLLNPIAPASLE